MVFDHLEQEVKELQEAEELDGKLGSQNQEDKLMRSVLESDKQSVDQANLIQEATNRNIGSFTPDLLYQQFVKNYHIAKQIYGPKLIRLLSGYDPNYIEKNLNIPEFQRELKQALEDNINAMKDDGLLDKEGIISQSGAELGAMVLIKELDAYVTKDKIGEKINKQHKHYGEKGETRPYRKGDRYKDIHLRQSIRKAIRRGHQELHSQDLITAEREGKGHVSLIFALDASASMKGTKIEHCKKAGITLAHKAIEEKNDVGLIVFGSDIKKSLKPSRDFNTLLQSISTIKASRQTDLAAMITRSIELFPPTQETKHLIILTDALPTVGKEPEKEALKAAGNAYAAGITISLIGVQLDKAGEELARELTTIGHGRFTLVRDLDKVGHIVLEDYYSVR